MARGRVVKGFYDRFWKEHEAFSSLVEGLAAPGDRERFASVTLGQLIFVTFVQRRGFLDDDRDYLRNRLWLPRRRPTFFRHFLRRLFHEGLTSPKAERKADLDALLGRVPSFNGGAFDPSELELAHPDLDVPDEAFERVFDFFDAYRWHLDDRPPAAENEIRPDILGTLFEQSVNFRQERKEKGAYYTGEDITEYIARATIIPSLLGATAERCPDSFRPDGPVWRLLRDDPDRYLFEAARHGVDRSLPAEVAVGLRDVKRREGWNRPSADGYGLPTETWREHVARRERCHEVRRQMRSGKVRAVDDLVTHNLDVRRFAEDAIASCTDPAFLRAVWAALRGLSVLDPTCGAGAFLFAALDVLEPLYDACLNRMEALLREAKRPEEFRDFAAIREDVERHPNRRLFVLKSIVVRNLYGVDLMKEATAVCKLRLLLKLIAQARTAADLESLRDVDFNVRAGNALVGFARSEEVTRPGKGTLDAARLDRHLAGEYGIDAGRAEAFRAWRAGHRPFHWFAEFREVMASGGFDVILGNPPYVESAKVRDQYAIRGYATEGCGNLYAHVVERSKALLAPRGRAGMIVPHSAFCTDRMAPLLGLFAGPKTTWVSTYDIRPSKLFAGVDQRLAIYLTAPSAAQRTYGTRYQRWHEAARPHLFRRLRYADVGAMVYPNAVAKAEDDVERRIWEKLRRRRPLGDDLGGRARVYYHNAPRYWVRAMTFAPYFRNARDGAKVSAQVKSLPVGSRAAAAVTAAALNSSLFYWWFLLFSDSRHLNRREIDRFPLGLGEMADAAKQELQALCGRLMEDYRRHATRKTCQYQATGRVVYDEFFPGRSKGLLDEIDRILARHYGFTGEELDFLVNYDVKFRMGREDGRLTPTGADETDFIFPSRPVYFTGL